MTLTTEERGRLLNLLTARDVLPCERKRYLALWNVWEGKSAGEVEALGIMNADSVRRNLKLFLQGGFDALKERVHPGQASVITPAVQQIIRDLVQQDDRVWTATTLSEELAEHHGVQIGRSGLSGQIKKMGLSYQRTRYVVAGQADEQEKDELKRDLEALKGGQRQD